MFSYLFCEAAQQLITSLPPPRKDTWRERESRNCLLLINQTKGKWGSKGEGAFFLFISFIHLTARVLMVHQNAQCLPCPTDARSHPPQHGSILNRQCKRDPPTNAKPLPGEFGNRINGKRNQKPVMEAKARLRSPSHVTKSFLKLCLKTKQRRKKYLGSST